jgi:hypothetical protein
MITGVRSEFGWTALLIEDCSGWLYCQPIKMEQMMEYMVTATEKMDAKTDTN